MSGTVTALADVCAVAIDKTLRVGGSQVFAVWAASRHLSYEAEVRLPIGGSARLLAARTERLAEALGVPEAAVRVRPCGGSEDRDVDLVVADRQAVARVRAEIEAGAA